MTEKDYPNVEAGAVLKRMLERQGLSPNAAARGTNGAISASTVRSYCAGAKVTSARLIPLARLLGQQDGADVLRAFGLVDAADALAERDSGIDSLEVHGITPPEDESRQAAVEARLSAIEARLSALEHRTR